MSSNIEVCNIALSRVGASLIQSLTDKSKSANACNVFLPLARDTTLRFHDWAFARKRVSLAELGEEYSNFDYSYQYPSDCLCARKITGVDGSTTSAVWDYATMRYVYTGKVKYEIGLSSVSNTPIILTNQELAELVYTARATNFNIYDSMFVEALAWKLAADLAMPLLNKPEMQQAFYQNFLYAIQEAKVANSNEEEIVVDESSSFLKSRL